MKKPLVVITGASAGIGASVARRFAAENYPLALTARRQEKLEELQKELKTQTSIYALDVTDSDAVAKIIAQIEHEQGPIGILVNNAGLALGLEPAYDAKISDWDTCVDTNIKGLLYCTRAVLPSMVQRNSGHIVNLGSIAGTYPYPGGNVYGSTKAFVHQFSLNLRADLLGTKVRVSCIEPGLTGGTEFSVVRFRGDAEKAQNLYKNTEALLPEDIAEAIYFCCTLPPHVNINTIEMMPVSQASSALNVHRH
ncbi:MAG: SDR family NAD(P)-dependent oxidoreductase [Verrucomicrobia bacterium]|nr:SDR family NAD(P)-dependent oxidoreductase [Verrucomicrobiota bacterium]